MLQGCLARIIPIALILGVILWFLRSPESVAGLITAGITLVGNGADSFGRFVSALTPTISNLF